MNYNQNTNTKVISALFWKYMERGGTQGIHFIIQLVLARLLLPKDYGVIALVTVFISLANVFIQSGFNTALIQKKDADEIDFSSVFYLSLFIATLLYAILFFTSSNIANFYSNPELVPILRVLSITLFIGAFNSIQNAYVAKNMMFKKLFFSSIGAIVISGVTGIVCAYIGLGVWTLVVQQLVSLLSTTIILWFTIKWRPHLLFSIKRIKILFSFGWKLLVSSLLNTFYIEIRTLIIGRVYSSSMLGYYNRGEQFPKLIVTNIDGSIQSVMLPAFSAQQDNRKRVKEMVRRSIVTSSFLLFPLMIGLAVVAEPLVKVILSDKWLPSVTFLQIFCISYALRPIHTANLQAINALGKSDIFLKLEIIKKIIGFIILIISMQFGIYTIALGMVMSGIVSSFINAYPNRKLLDYSYIEQWKDIMPSLLISLVMGAAVYTLSFLNIEIWQILILQITSGIVIYTGLAILFKLESFSYLVNTLKEIKNLK